jgi:hypothetical protein
MLEIPVSPIVLQTEIQFFLLGEDDILDVGVRWVGLALIIISEVTLYSFVRIHIHPSEAVQFAPGR